MTPATPGIEGALVRDVRREVIGRVSSVFVDADATPQWLRVDLGSGRSALAPAQAASSPTQGEILLPWEREVIEQAVDDGTGAVSEPQAERLRVLYGLEEAP